jgi:hypothetical protein
VVVQWLDEADGRLVTVFSAATGIYFDRSSSRPLLSFSVGAVENLF